MANDPHSNTPLLTEGQSQAELTANAALSTISGFCQLCVESGLTTNNNTPPGSPTDGLRYWVGTSPTGAWATHASTVATYLAGLWTFTAAQEGWIAWDRTSDKLYRFTSTTVKVEIAPLAEHSKHITILNPTTTEDTVIAWFNRASTITRIVFGIKGTGSPSRMVTIRKNSDRSATGTEVVTGGTVVTNTTTGQTVTSFNSASIPAGNFLWLETTAGSGTTITELYVTVWYTEDS